MFVVLYYRNGCICDFSKGIIEGVKIMLYLVNVDHITRDKDNKIKVINENWRIEADNHEEMREVISEYNGLLCGTVRIDKSIWKEGWKEE